VRINSRAFSANTARARWRSTAIRAATGTRRQANADNVMWPMGAVIHGGSGAWPSEDNTVATDAPE